MSGFVPSLTIADSTTCEPTLSVTQLYAERGSLKYEKAARRWLQRYLKERDPSLVQFARLAGGLAKRVE
jgi:hypothetical protein